MCTRVYTCVLKEEIVFRKGRGFYLRHLLSSVSHPIRGPPVITPPADVRIKYTHRTLDSDRRYTSFTECQTSWLCWVFPFIYVFLH